MIKIDIGVIVSLITVIGSIIVLVRWAWHQVDALDSLLDDWHGEPARPGVPARLGVMERLDRIERTVNSAAFNSRPNHGSSAYDEHTRLLKEILERIDNDQSN